MQEIVGIGNVNAKKKLRDEFHPEVVVCLYNNI